MNGARRVAVVTGASAGIGDVAFPGMAVGWLALAVERNAKKKTTSPETKGRRIALRAAGGLGMLGFLLLVVGTGHGDALNGA